MNTFRRPMFRGGPVDSRGTGITSGLSYNKGGRVGYRPGGQVTGGSIMDRIRSANSLFFNDPARFAPGFDRTQPRTFLGMNIPGTGMAVDSEGNPISIPKRNFAEDALFFLGPGKFLKAGGGGLNIFKEMGKRNLSSSKELVPFKETPFLSNQYFRNILQPYTAGMKETLKSTGRGIKDYGIIGALGIGGGGVGYSMIDDYLEDYADEQFKGKEPPAPEENKELTPDEARIKELERRNKELNDLLNRPSTKKNVEESVEIDKEKFAKILGKDKARGQDIADMLLSFSSKALAPDATVKSAFAEFAADEVKRPSRTRSIEDNAAALAINKYIKGEISRGELDKLMALDKAKLTNKMNIARASLTFEGVLAETAQKANKSATNLGVIQRALKLTPATENLAFGGELPKGEDAASKITPDTIYVRDSIKADGAKELIYIDSATGELVVFKTIFR